LTPYEKDFVHWVAQRMKSAGRFIASAELVCWAKYVSILER
jgi:hypothetical protein